MGNKKRALLASPGKRKLEKTIDALPPGSRTVGDSAVRAAMRRWRSDGARL